MLLGLGLKKMHFNALELLHRQGGSATLAQLNEAKVQISDLKPLERIGLTRETPDGAELTQTAVQYFRKRKKITLGEKHDLAVQSMAANRGTRTFFELRQGWTNLSERDASRFGIGGLIVRTVRIMMKELEDLGIVKKKGGAYSLSAAALEMALEKRAQLISQSSARPKRRGKKISGR